ncbi:hypothetical protein GCM10009678_10790 [Actinomadura kijaniata]|uniref:Uncharacterized protein n=1 Tax=Actinomadura namibiensis TaxID=182080 RepID=A0A7W3QJA5_ACTNM|nr:hypothetical protein [Actinomadura namibiensis]MBA8949181.1 hypothetical protein [Actinomadura namibiensis]
MVECFHALVLTGTPGVVRGRCREAFRAGEVFTVARDAGGDHPVSLTVREIRVYGRPVDELTPVVTAELVPTGRGAGRLAAGTLLCRTA